MGAMIMLLVLVAWNVQELASSPAEETAPTLTAEEAEELREKIDMLAEEADWFSEHFILARQESEAELSEYQAKLALAEKETQRIKEEILRLEQLARQLDSQVPTTPDEVEYLKGLLAQQQQRRAAAERELAELQKEAAQKEKSYAVVPSRGADGTFRRPIYIECRDNKMIIQPEGIELVPADFVALDRPDNPFDTVLRAIRQYYVETEQIVRGSEPYPLFIVRPSGVEMYENAHTRLVRGNLTKDFGYEIVNEDWHIQYPEPNEELRSRIHPQLATARNRLTGYLVATRQMATPAPGYGAGYGNSGGGNSGGMSGGGGGHMPQQFRTDHRGNVIPMGGGIRSPEDFRQLMDKESGTEPRAIPGQEPGMEQRAVPGHEPGMEQRAIPGQESAGQTVGNNNPQQRPQNWALQGATQYTRGLSRTVIIRCESDRFVLSAQPGLRTERAVPIAGSVPQAADQLVRAIWEFQQSWGSAGENVHWRPILQVRVSPGGEQRLQELRNHLRNSGLVIEE